MDCIFCKIVKGEIDSAKVLENDKVLAFLDVNPVAKGHCLVIPKMHFENIFDITDEILGEVIFLVKYISENLKNSFEIEGINLVQSSGSKAGQAIFHFHLHIIPRYQGDLLGHPFDNAEKGKTTLEELKKIADKIHP